LCEALYHNDDDIATSDTDIEIVYVHIISNAGTIFIKLDYNNT